MYQMGMLNGMRPPSSLATAGFRGSSSAMAPLPGQPGMGITVPYQTTTAAGVVDLDPITPGTQTTPGIVTQTGPTIIISGPDTNLPMAPV